MEVVCYSWKARTTMKVLVAAHGVEETVQVERGHLLVAQINSKVEGGRGTKHGVCGTA